MPTITEANADRFRSYVYGSAEFPADGFVVIDQGAEILSLGVQGGSFSAGFNLVDIHFAGTAGQLSWVGSEINVTIRSTGSIKGNLYIEAQDEGPNSGLENLVSNAGFVDRVFLLKWADTQAELDSMQADQFTNTGTVTTDDDTRSAVQIHFGTLFNTRNH